MGNDELERLSIEQTLAFLSEIAARGSARAAGAHVCGLRGVNRHAPVAAIYDQNHFEPAGSKLCEAFNPYIRKQAVAALAADACLCLGFYFLPNLVKSVTSAVMSPITAKMPSIPCPVMSSAISRFVIVRSSLP